MNLVVGKVYHFKQNATYYTYVRRTVEDRDMKYIGSQDPIYEFAYFNKFGSGTVYRGLVFVDKLVEAPESVQVIYAKS